METIAFRVKGSAPDAYEVTFTKDGAKLSANCTCQAGANGLPCKHRFSILAGDSAGIVSANTSDVQIVTSWLPGSNLQEALNTLRAAEHDLDIAKKALAAAKKKIASAMR